MAEWSSWSARKFHKLEVAGSSPPPPNLAECRGTCSYIVEGLGNPDSFMSSSHGAGRLMSRSQAIRTLNLEDEIKKLDSKGIVHALRSQRDLDEAASAYKDIDQVIALETDLVKVKTKLEPIAVIKG